VGVNLIDKQIAIGDKSKTISDAKGNSRNDNKDRTAPNKIIELGIFVDYMAVGLFMPYLGVKEYGKLRELILTFVNAVSNELKVKTNFGENDQSCSI
jgi:hypothetical protein